MADVRTVEVLETLYQKSASPEIANQLAASYLEVGQHHGDNAALEAAIRVWLEDVVPRTQRSSQPGDWAATQNNLGNALLTLGQREAGTPRLEAAVAACRNALEERTRDRVPLDWAMTQNNLGAALWTLGQRATSTDRLEDAVAAYHAALDEWTRDRVPLLWAKTQNNLGLALWTLGKRETGTERFEDAVTAFRNALDEYTRDRVPLQWATTKANLSLALAAIARRSGGPMGAALAEIDAALDVFRAAGATAYLEWAEAVRRGIARG